MCKFIDEKIVGLVTRSISVRPERPIADRAFMCPDGLKVSLQRPVNQERVQPEFETAVVGQILHCR